MSLAQRELGNIFYKTKKKEMANRFIEIIRYDANKITIWESFDGASGKGSPLTYPNSKLVKIGDRMLVIDITSGEEYYDCRYEDCTIKRLNG
jgi:hypothetical protein